MKSSTGSELSYPDRLGVGHGCQRLSTAVNGRHIITAGQATLFPIPGHRAEAATLFDGGVTFKDTPRARTWKISPCRVHGGRHFLECFRNFQGFHPDRTRTESLLIVSTPLDGYLCPTVKKQIPVIRLAVALSVLWLVGCGVVLLLEMSQLPPSPGRERLAQRPAFEAFFKSRKIDNVLVRHPQLGLCSFPSTMTRPEIENAIQRSLPKLYATPAERKEVSPDAPLVAPIEWDVTDPDPNPKPSNFYSTAFYSSGFLRIAMFPAVAIFVAVLAVGFGTRWVVRGFKP